MDKKPYLLLLLTMASIKHLNADGTIPNPYFHFPGGSEPFMGFITTIAVPVEAKTPGEVLLSIIFEANYVLPTNETEFEYPPIIGGATSLERTFFYNIVQRKIEEFGYSGKECLLRAICEGTEYSTQNTGVLGDILHIFLIPSSSRKEANLSEYEESEKHGKLKKCKQYKQKCSFSILNAFSKISNILDVIK